MLPLISIQQYAIKHKISTFATIKLINQGKLKTIKKVVDGKEQELILDESTPEQAISIPEPLSEPINYEEAYQELLIKYNTLQEKYTALMEEKSLAKR